MASKTKDGSKIIKVLKTIKNHPKTGLAALAGAMYLSSDATVKYTDKVRARMMLENYRNE